MDQNGVNIWSIVSLALDYAEEDGYKRNDDVCQNVFMAYNKLKAFSDFVESNAFSARVNGTDLELSFMSPELEIVSKNDAYHDISSVVDRIILSWGNKTDIKITLVFENAVKKINE